MPGAPPTNMAEARRRGYFSEMFFPTPSRVSYLLSLKSIFGRKTSYSEKVFKRLLHVSNSAIEILGFYYDHTEQKVVPYIFNNLNTRSATL